MDLDRDELLRLLLAGFGGYVLGAGSSSVLTVFQQSIDQVPVQIFNATVSTGFSATVLVLYYFQYRTSSEQTRIDQESTRAENSPILEIVKTQFDGDLVKLDIANYSDAAATDLQLFIRIQFDGVEKRFGQPVSNELSKVNTDTGEELDASSIRPQEEPVRFIAKAFVGIEEEDGELNEMSFKSLVDGLCEYHTNLKAEVELTVEGKDNRGHEVNEKAGSPLKVNLNDISGENTLENVYQSSTGTT